jgi:hypothetical protein
MKTTIVKPLSIEDFRPESDPVWRHKPGTLVEVRPCGDRYGGKTYVGIYIGDAPIGLVKTEEGGITTWRNPMILIPETHSVVYGCESWWCPIDSIEQLKQITDEDIENVWYVKLLKEQLDGKRNSKKT